MTIQQTTGKRTSEARSRPLTDVFTCTSKVCRCTGSSLCVPYRTNRNRIGPSAGEAAERALDANTLTLLARYYNEVADLRPCLDLVPLFPFASWSLGTTAVVEARPVPASSVHPVRSECVICFTPVQYADRVALLEDLQGVLGKCQQGQSRQLTQDLNYRRAGELPPVLLHPLQAPESAQFSGEPAAAPAHVAACQHINKQGPFHCS